MRASGNRQEKGGASVTGGGGENRKDITGNLYSIRMILLVMAKRIWRIFEGDRFLCYL